MATTLHPRPSRVVQRLDPVGAIGFHRIKHPPRELVILFVVDAVLSSPGLWLEDCGDLVVLQAILLDGGQSRVAGTNVFRVWSLENVGWLTQR